MWRRKALLLMVFACLSSLGAAGSADFDNSLQVDINDLALLVNYWLYDYNDNIRCSSWDLYENGVIDFNDLAVITELWLSDYNFEDFSDFARYWRRVVDYRFLDEQFDLNSDGRVDWGDFAAFSNQWLTTLNPCDDTNVTGVWQDQGFTDIAGCGIYDCFPDEFYSRYVYDDCRNFLYVRCESTQEFNYLCAYNYWFSNRRVGLCVYDCGINAFQIMKNVNGTRILRTRHRTQDQLVSGCDEGTFRKYDWQVVVYDDVNGVRTGYCRQSYSDPNANNLWEADEGEPSSCELVWW